MKVNEIVYFHFTVFDADGITPLSGQAGAVTKVLRYNNTMSVIIVTVAEIGVTGSYYASFTPNAVGFWDVRVTNPDTRVVGEQYIIEVNDKDDIVTAVEVNETKIDALPAATDTELTSNHGAGSWQSADLTTLEAAAVDLINLLENKLTINESNSTLILWNDAGDTPIKVWPLTNKDDNNVVLTGTGPANRGKRTT